MMKSTTTGSSVARSARKLLQRVLLGVLVSAAGATLALCIEACGADSATSGQRVALETRVELMPGAGSFTTAAGWDVTLTKAVVSTGAFYYFDGPPPLVRRPSNQARRLRQLALGTLGLRRASAHPGHYEAGNALGQMLESWSVDLLAGPSDLPPGEGVTGTYRSARFTFTDPGAGPMASELEGHAALVEGRAERAGEAPRVFRAVADRADIARSAANGSVDGCELSEVEVTSDGRVTVAVNPKVWLDLADFSELEPAAGDTPLEFPADSQPKIAFAQGLAQLSAYKFSYSSP